MKFYLAVEHTEDNDADYFKFTSLHLAVRYIQEEGLDDWLLSDKPFTEENNELLEDGLYTFIG